MSGTPRVDLEDSRLFESNRFWPVLAWLRAHDPVHWHARAGRPGFWVLTRHRDVVEVYQEPEAFSSRYGMRLDSNADAVAAVAQRMLIVSDPPDHGHLKRVLSRAFGAEAMPAVEALVRRVVPEVLGPAVESGEVDFVEVAGRIPNHVVCSLMGIPRSDWDWVGRVTTDAFEGADEQARSAAHGEIFLYFADLLAERRRRPGDDFVSRIAGDRRATSAQGADRSLSDEEIIFNCNGVLSGGNETTRYAAAGGLLALTQHPDQWAALRRAGPGGVPGAVEEVLRWTVPGVHALRTATRDVEVAGVPIAAGDQVTLWNVSANRDEAVFTEPDRFDVSRWPNHHVTFGAGRHLCLGARLARAELAVFLAELIGRVERVRLQGEPAYNTSNFTWGLRSLPVRLERRRP